MHQGISKGFRPFRADGARGDDRVSERVPPPLPLGFLWGGVAAALVAVAPVAPRIAASLPACPVRALAGIPCPGCGAARSAVALARFDPLEAIAVSPLAAIGWSLLVGGGLWVGALALTGRGVPDLPTRLPATARGAIVAAVLANWTYLVWHG